MQSFYLTLTSGNTDGHFADGNTPGRFRVHLGKAINLQGAYEFGLAELHAPLTLVCRRKTEIKGGAGDAVTIVTTTDADNPGCHLLNIHCNLMADQPADHGHHRIIRTINIKREKYKKGETRTYSFGKIFYYPLSTHHFSNIEVYISTDKQEQASFEGGTLSLLLHFRRTTSNGGAI